MLDKIMAYHKAKADLIEALHNTLDYLEPRIDVNWEGTGPNEAMVLYTQIKVVLEQLEAP